MNVAIYLHGSGPTLSLVLGVTCMGMYKNACTKQCVALLILALACRFYLPRTFIIWSNKAQALKVRRLWYFFILTRFVLVKYSRAFVERPLQGTS